ncbi:hypothetical protein [Oerskovia douganii]|uniref:hypothetical protein n=1 Tax=Oerskovia douganii TaxID=2762210 RepID=UPI001D1255A3|nr:hypothetical protein [Oerskovia douganii]
MDASGPPPTAGSTPGRSPASGTPPTPPPLPRGAWLLRGVTAAGLLLSADVHLFLYVQGYRDIEVVGPLFLLNAVAGFALGLLVLVWRHWLPLLGAVGFSVATLGAFYLSTTVGFFAVEETLGGVQQVTAAVSEWVALVGALLALVVERRRSSGRSRKGA